MEQAYEGNKVTILTILRRNLKRTYLTLLLISYLTILLLVLYIVSFNRCN